MLQSKGSCTRWVHLIRDLYPNFTQKVKPRKMRDLSTVWPWQEWFPMPPNPDMENYLSPKLKNPNSKCTVQALPLSEGHLTYWKNTMKFFWSFEGLLKWFPTLISFKKSTSLMCDASVVPIKTLKHICLVLIFSMNTFKIKFTTSPKYYNVVKMASVSNDEHIPIPTYWNQCFFNTSHEL